LERFRRQLRADDRRGCPLALASYFGYTLRRILNTNATIFSRIFLLSTVPTPTALARFKRPLDERADSWYPFGKRLIKYPMIASLAGSREVIDHFLDAFHTARGWLSSTIIFSRFITGSPLFALKVPAQITPWWPVCLGSGPGQQIDWRTALSRRSPARHPGLDTVPAERLFHEPQELPTVHSRLRTRYAGRGEILALRTAPDVLLVFDPSQKSHDVRGMVQAAASILYPAFKENVEAVLPWTGILKRGIAFEGLLRFMDQQRRTIFISSRIAREAPASLMAFIPSRISALSNLAAKPEM